MSSTRMIVRSIISLVIASVLTVYVLIMLLTNIIAASANISNYYQYSL